MIEPIGRKPALPPERSQTPLWFAIGALCISVTSFSMHNTQLGDVVFWAGGVIAVIAMAYWFFQPRHGLKK